MWWFFQPKPLREIHISVWNLTQAYTNTQVSSWCEAIQKQIDEHFFPVWKLRASISLDRAPVLHAWQAHVTEDSDGIRTGWHQWDVEYQAPILKVFTSTCETAGLPPSGVLSHEILETLANPSGATLAQYTKNSKPALIYTEVCDPVGQDYYTINNIPVCNFVTPDFFYERPAPRYDFLGHVTAPLTAGPRGQLLWLDQSFWGHPNFRVEQKG
jgi:hypothetical protein